MSDIKHLIKIYDQYKKIKGYSDGGDVQDPKDQEKKEKSPFDFSSLKPKAQSTPDPDKTKDVQESFKKAMGFSDGGQVEDQNNKEFEASLQRSNHRHRVANPTYDLYKESNLEPKMGDVKLRESYNNGEIYKQKFADGGTVPSQPVIVDPNKAKIFSDGFKKALGYADGGQIPDPVTGNVDPNSPEGLAMIQNANYPPAPMTNAPASIEGDEQKIQAQSKAPNPASEQDLKEENPDDKELEQQYANEEFEADEKAPEVASKDDSEEDDNNDESSVAEGSKNPERQIASDQSSPDMKAQASPNTELADAQEQRRNNVMLGNLQRGLAIGAAGYAGANVKPDLALKQIDEQQKTANMPVEEYNEKIQNQKNDPNSTVSKVVRDYFTTKGMKVPPNATANDLYNVAPFIIKDQKLHQDLQIQLMKDQTKKTEGLAGRQAADQRNQRTTDATKEAAKLRADAMKAGQDKTMGRQDQRLAGQLVTKIHSDSVIKPSEQNMASLDKSQKILDNKSVPLSPQLLADAEQDIASALTIRGMGGTEGKIKRSELVTLSRQLAVAKQKYLNQPDIDLRKEDPALVEQIRKTNKALHDDYKTTIKERKQEIAKEFQPMAENSPRIQKTIDQYINSDSKQPSINSHPQDQQAMDWAKANPNDPRSAAILKANGVE